MIVIRIAITPSLNASSRPFGTRRAYDAGAALYGFTAEPGSRDEETLRLLGSWAATSELPNPAAVRDSARSAVD
jgi:hypothetical protein